MEERNSVAKSEKQVLRKEISLLRKKLDEREVIVKSNEIERQLFMLDEIKSAKTILFYVSFDNEVSTKELIKLAVMQDKRVAVPKVDKKYKELMLYELNSFENDLESGTWGILEPKPSCKIVGLDEIDTVIVPGIVFDKSGYRIGYGGGYYDRLLKKNGGKVSIGLAFELQIIDRIPHEKHDCQIKILVTEKQLMRF